MPSEKQKTITVPLSVWNRYIAVYEANPDQWRDLHNVRSVTGLIVYILRKEVMAMEVGA